MHKRTVLIGILAVVFFLFLSGFLEGQTCDNCWADAGGPWTGINLYGVIYGPDDEIFVAVGDGVYTSEDSLTWTSRDPDTTNMLFDVTYGNGRFVAVGASGTIVTSEDGINWTARTSNTSNNLNGIAYGNSMFIAVGDFGIIRRSSNGTSWSSDAGIPGLDFHDIAWGNSKFVRISNFGIEASPNGYSWHPKFPTGNFYGVDYCASYGWVIVGLNGVILTSPYGDNWTSQTSPTTKDLYAVTFGDSSYHTYDYVAAGEDGTIISSANGSSWNTRSSGTTSDLNGAGYHGGQFFCPGNTTLRRSGPVLGASPLSWDAPPEGGSTSINITDSSCGASIAYSRSENDPQDFITLGSYSGTTPGSFNVTAAKNNSGSTRSASIELSGMTKQSVIVSINQAAAAPPPPPPPPPPGWSPPDRMTWNSGTSTRPVIFSDQFDNLHLFWIDDSSGRFEIYYKKSTNAGANWSIPYRLTWTAEDSLYLHAAPGPANTLHLIWSNQIAGGGWDIFYKKSTNSGVNWTSPQRVTWMGGEAVEPWIAVDSSDDPYIVWRTTAPESDIFFKKSPDSGQTWSAIQRLTWSTGASEKPRIAVDSLSRIHIQWADDSQGNKEIFYKKSTDSGTTWSVLDRLTWNSGSSIPGGFLCAADNTLHLVFYDDTFGNDEVFYKKSSDGGTSWTGLERLTWSPGSSQSPAIAMEPLNNPALVWSDYSTGNWEILYKRSSDGGLTWSIPGRLTWNGGGSLYPFIAVDSNGDTHVVWTDDLSGNFEIYYKKKEGT